MNSASHTRVIEHVIAASIRHRWPVIGAAVLLALTGWYAVLHTPMDAIPDLSETQIIVFADWQGHSPQEIEDQVTYPLAIQLQGMTGVRVVRSSSDFNFSMIHIIFEDEIDILDARRQVAERLAAIKVDLPVGVVPYLAPEAPATGQIFWYTLEGNGYDLGRLRTLQDWHIKHQLASVEGVAEVATVGGFPMEYRITVDPRRLAALGVTLDQLTKEVQRANFAVGGHVMHTPTAEYLVEVTSSAGSSAFDRDVMRAVRELEGLVIPTGSDSSIRLGEIATIGLAAGPRRGVLEMDGNEVVGGVVLMRFGQNPLDVTRRLKQRIAELQPSLPPGVRIVTGYDRTPLIEGAIHTVTRTLLEAILTATICVLLVLRHFRASLVITLTLPLTVFASFVAMWALRRLGVVDIQTNTMSLAGLVISIGILVDASIVMTENVMHQLKRHYGNAPVRGDVRHLVLPACQAVGRPIFFSVLIMLLSFLPVFALGGLEGKMFRPLAFTKSFAMIAVALLAITLVPALCSLFVRGHLRSDRDNRLMRNLIEAYQPVLNYLLDRPAAIIWLMAVTFLVGFAPLGHHPVWLAEMLSSVTALGQRPLVLIVLVFALIGTAYFARSRWSRAGMFASLVLVAMAADRLITPIIGEFVTPLDEGTVMDMPITVPRASVSQAVDDLKARDMMLCRFPEVEMVMGKAGRAETPTDPAPIDMIETMVSFRPNAQWPRRKLREADAQRRVEEMFQLLVEQGYIAPLNERSQRQELLSDTTRDSLRRFDILMRECAFQSKQQHQRGIFIRAAIVKAELMARPGGTTDDEVITETQRAHQRFLLRHVRLLDKELAERAPGTFVRIALETLLEHSDIRNERLAGELKQLMVYRHSQPKRQQRASHHGGVAPAPPEIDPLPVLDGVHASLTKVLAPRFVLKRKVRADLIGFGGELDQALQMPGWTNVWTMPIQNRVDMLATGVNTTVGVRVLGDRLDAVVETSQRIAEVLQKVPGAVDVVADPIRGKGYLKIDLDRNKLSRLNVSLADANETIAAALGGVPVALQMNGRERHTVRLAFPAALREDLEALRRLPVIRRAAESHSAVGRSETAPTKTLDGGLGSAYAVDTVNLGDIATIEIAEGPATIKGENGLLRNYVRLNVDRRDPIDFVEEAQRTVRERVKLPAGVHVEWTGQFEHQLRSRRTLTTLLPIVLALIMAILYLTYHDLADAILILLAIPGAVAGGLFAQWLMDFKFSVNVWIGYIACLGMATSTGIIMLVYLREAVDRAGGIERISLAELRRAVMEGAVHRLRPKLLTEATTIVGLAPMLWASGVGSEVIRPMAAPVLGGILVADEVIDLFLPAMFYWVRRWRWHRVHAGATSGQGEADEAEKEAVEMIQEEKTDEQKARDTMSVSI